MLVLLYLAYISCDIAIKMYVHEHSYYVVKQLALSYAKLENMYVRNCNMMRAQNTGTRIC